MSDRPSPLGELLGSDTADAFVAHAWPHSPFRAQREPSALPSWLSSELWSDPRRWDDVYTSSVEVTRGGRAQYRVSGASVSAWVEDLGLAVRLAKLEEHLPEARTWLRGLERELGLPQGSGELNAFINAPQVGLGAHCDPSEHLLIHVHGEKRIRILPAPKASFRSVSHALTFPPKSRDAGQFADGFPDWTGGLPSEAEEIVLRPGTVLFMPRGCYHETLGGEAGVSATVVVRMLTPSYADVFVSYLSDYLRQSAHWRTPATGAWSGHSDAPHVAALGALIKQQALQLSELDVARMFACADAARAPAAGDRYVRNPSISVSCEAGAICLHTAQGHGARETFALGEESRRLVLALAAQRAPQSFAQLCERFANWDEGALQTVLRFLVRKQVLVPLTVEPLTTTPRVHSAAHEPGDTLEPAALARAK